MKGLILKYLVSYVKIMASNLPHSFLREAQFSRSILNGSNFMSSEFTGANFTNASLRRSDLSMCALENIDAAGADFAGSTFNYATLAGADLSGAVLNDMALNAVGQELAAVIRGDGDEGRYAFAEQPLGKGAPLAGSAENQGLQITHPAACSRAA